MAETTIAATSVVGGKTPARSGGVNPRSRADALRQTSAANSNTFAFSKQIAVANDQQPAAQQTTAAEPGRGLLSTGSQLILAQTRTQDDQSSFADKSVLDTALNSYSRSQSSVIETISLSMLSSRATTDRIGEASA